MAPRLLLESAMKTSTYLATLLGMAFATGCTGPSATSQSGASDVTALTGHQGTSDKVLVNLQFWTTAGNQFDYNCALATQAAAPQLEFKLGGASLMTDDNGAFSFLGASGATYAFEVPGFDAIDDGADVDVPMTTLTAYPYGSDHGDTYSIYLLTGLACPAPST